VLFLVRLAALVDAFVHEPAKGIQNLRNEHEFARIKADHARIAEQLRALNRNLQRLHAVVGVPVVNHVIVEFVDVIFIILLVKFKRLAGFLLIRLLKLRQPLLRTILLLRLGVRGGCGGSGDVLGALDNGRNDADRFVRCVLRENRGTLRAPRNETHSDALLLRCAVAAAVLAVRVGGFDRRLLRLSSRFCRRSGKRIRSNRRERVGRHRREGVRCGG
jgi:hypothetical protein